MYIWIYVYVHIKFRGFDNLDETDSSQVSNSELKRKLAVSTRSNDIEQKTSGQVSQAIKPPPWNGQG
ncbi:uncharacterized protein Z518_05265 [Rhinocladiella mackenziei CBS 650.93]|uniref:Uncharacterized protein n=1 Tax=Rhinocladiella mackenziei CBS 650.93 TaxID=1442369 RepID=A0A0D2FQC3_9EURO|nr:uncharacterized protein Z518_05265 [Rhinocladiella mackenziei CBS 650.93]KIX04397.1 hypothetical protein Z518_05265 [Rhinocladiella mackenziei CBS 650.93]